MAKKVQYRPIIISGKREFAELFGVERHRIDSFIEMGMPAFQYKGGGNYNFHVDACETWILQHFAPKDMQRDIKQLIKMKIV